MTAVLIRGQAQRLPLPDESVDLVVTSPPYWSLRDYRDGGQSLAGQIGAEATWQEYIANLLGCTREWVRVLKPTGSIFVVLGDKYANDAKWGGATSGKHVAGLHGQTGIGRAKTRTGIPPKSVMALPWRYALACVDELGLTLREDCVNDEDGGAYVWAKKNGLPESVKDRCRRGHEYVFHFVKQPHYFSALDELREPHEMKPQRRPGGRPADRTPRQGQPRQTWPTAQRDTVGVDGHPLGKLPGSVWTIASAPLNVPEHIEHARCCGGRKKPGCVDGLDHHAAFPPALVRRIIRGWSPTGICTACGEGRRPVTEYTGEEGRHPGGGGSYQQIREPGAKDTNLADAAMRVRAITGYACACTPYTDHPASGGRTTRRDYNPGGAGMYPQGTYGRHQAGEYERVGPWREYHFDRWDPAPTRPAVILDPYSGTGTTVLVADVLGQTGIGIELSGDYNELATWRVNDPGERARALDVPRPPKQADGQEPLQLEFGGAA